MRNKGRVPLRAPINGCLNSFRGLHADLGERTSSMKRFAELAAEVARLSSRSPANPCTHKLCDLQNEIRGGHIRR
jgi:hypothetical protein